MMDKSVRRLLDEHLPEPPASMANPPLAEIRRRARRRTGAQVGAAIAAVAVVAVGTTAVLGDDTADPPPTGSTADQQDMLYPTYLPPGYEVTPGGKSATGQELRYYDPAGTPPIPLVIRRLPETAGVSTEWEPIQQATTRGRAAEVFMMPDGGMTLTWLEAGGRYMVSLEAPPNSQIDFAVEQTVDVLVAVADGLRPPG